MIGTATRTIVSALPALAPLTGCDSKPDRRSVSSSGPLQIAADAASAAYSACVDKAAAAIDVAADQPAALTDRALKACIAARAAVVAKVAAAQVAGGMDPTTATMVAERSVRVADGQLRDRANAAIVARKLTTKGG